MANHVHVVFTPLAMQPSDIAQTDSLRANNSDAEPNYHALSFIMQSLKGYTAWKANRLLGRSGKFWHHESYDHVVRDPIELQRIVTYVLNNPVKAGLVDKCEKWQWSYYKNPHRDEKC